MKRKTATFPLHDGEYIEVKRRMLNWASRFSILLLLDSNSYKDKHSRYECLMAVNVIDGTHDTVHTLDALHQKHQLQKDWLFGHICYDHKNEIEPGLRSGKALAIGFPSLQFFCPQVVCYIDSKQTGFTIESLHREPQDIYDEIMDCSFDADKSIPKCSFNRKISQEAYLDTISKLKKHIEDGDCYEINFCTEGYATVPAANPVEMYRALMQLSPAPFAAYYRLNDCYMMCASPERYLRKENNVVLSQPIKGTAKRGASVQEDEASKMKLATSLKDQAENVMIVDLVRNDLARSCGTGSIRVDELFGIYTFPQVHQMISTVSGTLREDATIADVLRYSFPMGSMTGAPKVKVMQLTEQYEQSRRELYAGTVGYISPDGNFDFNVVIRSLFYNAHTEYLSYHTGGAITYDSDPMQEWEEMRLKAWALERIFS